MDQGQSGRERGGFPRAGEEAKGEDMRRCSAIRFIKGCRINYFVSNASPMNKESLVAEQASVSAGDVKVNGERQLLQEP